MNTNNSILTTSSSPYTVVTPDKLKTCRSTRQKELNAASGNNTDNSNQYTLK